MEPAFKFKRNPFGSGLHLYMARNFSPPEQVLEKVDKNGRSDI